MSDFQVCTMCEIAASFEKSDVRTFSIQLFCHISISSKAFLVLMHFALR
ncbi:unnamed protein product [Haemonchus placei]|uniref:Uncharacterized protein n=1 Tax=Haemonchus placei TaxID=6290 RepID=A0A3P7VI39_HAEPC|nr:unnamed protein product [Haemonchus placei]